MADVQFNSLLVGMEQPCSVMRSQWQTVSGQDRGESHKGAEHEGPSPAAKDESAQCKGQHELRKGLGIKAYGA